MRPLPREGAVLEKTVRPGDTVHVITRDGQKLEFQVEQVSIERIDGKDQGVDVKEIAKIERRELSGWKTAGLGLGALTIWIAIGVATAFAGVVGSQ